MPVVPSFFHSLRSCGCVRCRRLPESFRLPSYNRAVHSLCFVSRLW